MNQTLSPGRDDAEQQLENLRERCHQPGGGSVVMRCMYLCSLHRLTPPEWLCALFARRAALVFNAELGGWDQAFGKPWRRRTAVGLRHERDQMALRGKIYGIVWDKATRDHKPINKALFAEIGKDLGLSRSTVERSYYREIKTGRPNIAHIRRHLSA